jgi:hypothetical protein
MRKKRRRKRRRRKRRRRMMRKRWIRTIYYITKKSRKADWIGLFLNRAL